MDLVIHVEGLDDPSGAIEISRLGEFISRFKAAVLRSAQAELAVPAYRRNLAGRPVPRFRLFEVSEGSTTLRLRSVEQEGESKKFTTQLVARHLDAVSQFSASGTWPRFMYPGERESWGRVYLGLVPSSGGSVSISMNGEPRARVNRGTAEELQRSPAFPTYHEIEIVGDLHLIEWEASPKFRIQAPEADLVFQLPESMKEHVDAHRWRRVKALAKWEVGTNRATLIGELADSAETPGVESGAEIAVPVWATSQDRRLSEFADLASGWIETDAKPIARKSIEAARELTRRIFETFGSSLPEDRGPYWVPISDGTVEFEWSTNGRELICRITNDGLQLTAIRDDDELVDRSVGQRELMSWIEWLLGGPQPPAAEDG